MLSYDKLHQVRTLTDLLGLAAEALREQDLETLEQLQDLNRGWMQTDEQRDTTHDLLDAMLEAADNA
jgi:hypothetical protein